MPPQIVPSDPGADTAIRWDAAEGSPGTTGMKCLPTNSRRGTSDVDLRPASPRRVPTGPQDPVGGCNSAVSDSISVRERPIVRLARRNEGTIALKGPGDGSGEGQMGNVGMMKRSTSTKAALAVVSAVFVVLGVCGPVTVAQPPNIAEQPLTLRAEDLNGHPIPHLRFVIVPLEYIPPEHRSAVFVLTDHRGVAESKVLTGIRYRIDFSEEWTGDIESLTFNGIVSEKPLIVTIPENPSTLHVVFSQTYRVTGTIRTTADSALQDVSLDLLGTARGDCYDCYPVEPDGAFALVTPTLPITIRPSDTDERWLFDPEHITVTEENQRDGLLFVASLREGERLQGRVEELGTGTPVAHASLMATWSCGSSGSVRRFVADSAGEFELPCIEGCTFRMEVESIGPYRRRVVTKTIASCDDELVLQVSRGGRLFGQVTDQWHDPIPDLAIRAVAGTQRHATQTDKNGAYEFTGLPPGSYALSVNDYDSPVEHRQLVLVAENGGVSTAVVGEELVDTRLDLRTI